MELLLTYAFVYIKFLAKCILAGCMLLPIRKPKNVEMLMLYDAIMLK